MPFISSVALESVVWDSEDYVRDSIARCGGALL